MSFTKSMICCTSELNYAIFAKTSELKMRVFFLILKIRKVNVTNIENNSCPH
jgi:hypothetical protein